MKRREGKEREGRDGPYPGRRRSNMRITLCRRRRRRRRRRSDLDFSGLSSSSLARPLAPKPGSSDRRCSTNPTLPPSLPLHFIVCLPRTNVTRRRINLSRAALRIDIFKNVSRVERSLHSFIPSFFRLPTSFLTSSASPCSRSLLTPCPPSFLPSFLPSHREFLRVSATAADGGQD